MADCNFEKPTYRYFLRLYFTPKTLNMKVNVWSTRWRRRRGVQHFYESAFVFHRRKPEAFDLGPANTNYFCFFIDEAVGAGGGNWGYVSGLGRMIGERLAIARAQGRSRSQHACREVRLFFFPRGFRQPFKTMLYVCL